MGLFDSLKNKIQEVQKISDEKNQQREENKRVAAEKADEASRTVYESIKNAKSGNGFMAHLTSDQVLNFTKDYYRRLVLPASKLSTEKLEMYSYTNDNIGKRNFKKKFSDYDEAENILFMWNVSTDKCIGLTEKYLYVTDTRTEDVSFSFSFKVETENISSFNVEGDENSLSLFVNGVTVVVIKSDRTLNRDKINLNYYFDAIEKTDFEISDDKIDQLIREKIGDAVYRDTKNYTEEDEKIIYFAWGLDSLTAKDYIMLTTKQFVMINRELFGATQNTKRFYYEDITSMAVEQNANGHLTSMLLNAALSLCNLQIYVAGANTRVSTLSVREAERAVEIYTQYRNEIRNEAKQPSVVIQQSAEDPISQIKKLKELFEAGIITEKEFEEKKAILLEKI